MDAVLALLIAVGVFVPCAIFGWSAITSKAPEAPEEPRTDGERDDEHDSGGQGEQRVDVHITVIRKATTVMLASIKNVLGVEQRPELPPAAADGGRGGNSPPSPSAPRPDAEGWDDPDLDRLEDLLGDADATTGEGGDRRPQWADAEVIRPPSPQPAAPQPVTPEPLPTGARPALSSAPTVPEAPSGRGLPEPEQLDHDHPGRVERARVELVDLEPVGATAPGRTADGPVLDLPPGRRYPLGITRDPAPALTGHQLDVDDPPVALEGVDMSQAPILRSSDGSAARLPTVGQMQTALATGGFQRLLSWLRAFKKASNNTLEQSKMLHADAMAIARRTRTKYALALQAFQAVQADRLDRQTINRMFVMLQQAEREAVAAAQATHYTAALVMAAGGAQPTVAAAINTLQRNHGAIAAAVSASPQPVQNMRWYQQ
jgi:hypothetical protein